MIFEQIGRINIKLEKNSNSINYPIKIKIKQIYNDSEPKFQDQGYGSDFSFLISNFDELNYAMNMNQIYKELVKPFLEKNKQNLAQTSELFRRFFYFDEPLKGKSYLGNTMGNPDKATFVSPHFSNGKTFTSRENYLSHFRNRHILNRIEAPITTLNIDLNYFICYFMPIYKSLIK